LQTVQFSRCHFQIKQQAQENNAFYVPSLEVVKKNIPVSPFQNTLQYISCVKALFRMLFFFFCLTRCKFKMSSI
jgi:hypothetical protein